MTKSVAILGCGPAGLLVAHAANMSGWDFVIYSRKQPSKLYGAQYWHAAIPNINCGGPRIVTYQLSGTPEEYRRKVYGDDWDGTVSPEDYMEAHYAWDIRAGYDNLWKLYQHGIFDCEITNRWATMAGSRVDLVISTVPRKIWAESRDRFESQKIWALGDSDEQRVYMHRGDEFTVVCDGRPETPWYRVSNIFGYCTMEWPCERSPYGDTFTDLPPARGASVVEKPLRHNSKAASDFIHLGRYGKWEKGVLTTDAFYDAMKVFADDKIG